MMFIGNDIIKVSRVDRLLKKYSSHFLNKIFSKNEIDIVNNKKNVSIHFSGKFAAKEASKKAFMAAGISKIYFKDIEILNKINGAPYIKINGLEKNKNIKNLQVSISHTNEYATAVTILDISD